MRSAKRARYAVEADDRRHLEHDDLWDGSAVLHQLIQWVGQRGSNLAREMRVDLGRAQTPVTEDLLDDPETDPGFV